MSTQIAVRLPDELVSYVDELVAAGMAPSRAAIITRALEQQRRRNQQEQDARIYAARGDDPDLAEFTRQAAAQPMDID
jgi:predicted transcriptional regulator